MRPKAQPEIVQALQVSNTKSWKPDCQSYSLSLTSLAPGTWAPIQILIISIGDYVISGSRPIETTAGCSLYTIHWEDYIGYAVTNESYAKRTEDEVFTGEFVRIYEKSAYLNFLTGSTFATHDYPGPFTHFAFCYLNHIVDVAACYAPEVSHAVAL